MKQQTKLATLLGLSGALIISGVAQAQAPGAPGAPPAAPPPAPMGDPGMAPGGVGGAGTGATDAGTVTNEYDSTSMTTSTTGLEGDTETLPNTGGAPLAMALLGSLTAGSAFLLRRKLS